MKNLLISILIIVGFLMFSKSEANYKKIFFDFSIKSIEGEKIELSEYKDKSVLLVNVASNCGFTKQYQDLQDLWMTYRDEGLIVLGVPSNQFGSQEPGTNEEIKNFCEVNFNVDFPMTIKSEVKGNNAHPIYLWAKDNYGRTAIPKWNFHKILINKEGKIQNTYSSFTSPKSKKITNEIENILNIK